MNDIKQFFYSIVKLAESKYKRDFSELKLVVDSKPEAKGTLAFYRTSTKAVHLNKVTIDVVDQQTLKHIIIHEIAHHVTSIVAPRRKQEHGPEFKRVDRSLGGLGQTKIDIKDASSEFRVKSSSRVTRTVEYVCLCNTYNVSMIRHNRIVSGEATYSCTKCNKKLIQNLK